MTLVNFKQPGKGHMSKTHFYEPYSGFVDLICSHIIM